MTFGDSVGINEAADVKVEKREWIEDISEVKSSESITHWSMKGEDSVLVSVPTTGTNYRRKNLF